MSPSTTVTSMVPGPVANTDACYFRDEDRIYHALSELAGRRQAARYSDSISGVTTVTPTLPWRSW